MGLRTSEMDSICSEYICNYLITDTDEENKIKSLSEAFNKYIQNEILNKGNTRILSRHVQNVTKRSDELYDKEVSFGRLNNLDAFFDEVNIEPTVDMFINLLMNNKILAFLIEDNIITGEFKLNYKKLPQIYEGKTLPMLVEAFGALNQQYIVDDLEKYLKCNGMSISDLGIKEKTISINQEMDLINKAKKNDKAAKQKLVEENLLLVYVLAYSYTDLGIEFFDLVQEGSIGLINSINKYNAKEDGSFTSFASRCVIKAIEDVLTNSNCSQLVVQKDQRKEYQDAKVFLYQHLGRIPTDEEMSLYLGVSIDEVKTIRNAKYQIESLNNFEESEMDILSAEDFTEDNLFDIKEGVSKIINSCHLTPREKRVLIHRWGLEQQETLTLEETGAMFDLSHERIRQIEAKALRKIIKYSLIDKYANYMEDEKEAMIVLNAKREMLGIVLESIYDYHPDRTKEEIDDVLAELNPKAQRIVNKKYQIFSSGPKERFTHGDKIYFHREVRPYMKERLGDSLQKHVGPIKIKSNVNKR